jgi:MarR family 2-MHQ and catechol resistance regulon transcriptional repressor
MKMKKEQIPGIIIGKLMNIGGMLERQGNKMLLPYNLNQQQFSIFFEIAKVGKVKQKEMVNRLLLEKAHVSKVVKKLQQMELITIIENDKDRRSYWLSVTKKGKEVLKKCTEMFAEWNKQWIREIDETELSSILDNLTILQNIFKQKTR